jgi:transmembrane sensor
MYDSDDEYMAELLVRHFSQETTDVEEQEVQNWINESSENSDLYMLLSDAAFVRTEVNEYNNVDMDAGRLKIWEKIRETERRHTNQMVSLGVVVLLLFGTFLIWSQQSDRTQSAAITRSDTLQRRPLVAAYGQALLEIGGLDVIDLDTVSDGVIRRQGDWQIVKRNRSISYKRMGLSQKADTVFSKLITGEGSTYQLVLQDGSQIQLSAASSIHFTSIINPGERQVQLKGRAYFEIVRDPTKPFHVGVKSTDIEVLGTRFNVSAYDEERSIKTALVQGSIVIRANGEEKTLIPGETASVTAGEPINVIFDRNSVAKATSWKSGEFNFKNDSITIIMRELARWYGIKILYKDTPHVVINSTPFPRSLAVDSALHIIETSGLVRIKRDKKIVTISSR